ncbi:hypothetical protein HCN44_008076 [Aphidius gifuensis]|uniref:E3 SUMO-protein ligase NSE2 n=1 Tax=Aphidius gifuensis TaxID=684658 RepID=A0A835CML8_APHGI|nr:hypothetical protein HCN44_008076 [Aphidius gifuensis]
MAELLAMGNDLLESCLKTATHAIVYSEGEVRDKTLEKLRKSVTLYCEFEEKMKNMQQFSQKYSNTAIENEDEMNKIIGEFTETANNSQVDLASNKHIKHFNQQVTAIIGSPSNKDNSDESDDDLVLTQDEVNVVCPITKARMTEPMRNVRCGHVYDKIGVETMIGYNKRTKCPIVGCGNDEFLTMDDLQPDMVTRAVLDRNT